MRGVDATALLRRYVRLHNVGFRTGDFGPLLELFHDAGEMLFIGVPFRPLRGRTAIGAAFRKTPPGDELRIGEETTPAPDRAEAPFGWSQQSGTVAGRLIVWADGGRIRRLRVIAQDA